MKFLLVCALVAGWDAVLGIEQPVPERYLRPRDFNHHPFTDVGESAAGKQQYALHDVHPYALLVSKRPREGRQFPEHGGDYLPNPPEEVLPRKHAAPLQIHLEPSPSHAPQYDSDPYNIIAKNYAFSYSVKDKHSGDDFSHSQAHHGDATRGQYRVKLPDGRVQVVSYTADDKGYRADVSYEGSPAQHTDYTPAAPAYVHSTPAPHTYDHPAPQQYIQATYEPPAQGYFQRDHGYTPESAYHPTASPAQYHHQPQQQHFSPTPPPYQSIHQYTPTAPSYPQEQVYSPTPASYSDGSQYQGPTQGYRLVQYDPQYASPAPQAHRFASVTPAPSLGKNFASPSPITFPTNAPETQSYPTPAPNHQGYASPAPYEHSGFASPSPTPYEPSAYGSPTPTPFAVSDGQFEARYVSATPSPFAVQPSQRSTPAPFASHRFVTSTESSHLGHILVTPRTQRSSNSEKTASRRIFGAREHVIYRYKSS